MVHVIPVHSLCYTGTPLISYITRVLVYLYLEKPHSENNKKLGGDFLEPRSNVAIAIAVAGVWLLPYTQLYSARSPTLNAKPLNSKPRLEAIKLFMNRSPYTTIGLCAPSVSYMPSMMIGPRIWLKVY